MRNILTGVVLASFGLISSYAFGAAAVSQTGSWVTSGFYSSAAGTPMQDPYAYGYTAPAIGSYTHYTPLMAATPAAPIYPTVFSLSDFQVAGGITHAFNDALPLTARGTAVSNIKDNYLPISTDLQDINVQIPTWRVRQNAGATGYLANELNFNSVYVIPNGSTLGNLGTLAPLKIKGSFGPAGYAQFEAIFEYTYTPFASTAGNLGIPVPLGDVRYQFDAATPNVPFNVTVPAIDTLTPLVASATNYGILEIHGYAWIAGDPFDVEVNMLPEPTSLGLVGLGAMTLLRRKRS